MLFWKLIQIDYVLKAILNFISVIGFLFGFFWFFPIYSLLYLKSGKRKKVSHAECLNCIFIAGIFNICCLSIGLFFIKDIKFLAATLTLPLFVLMLITVGLYSSTEDKNWDD